MPNVPPLKINAYYSKKEEIANTLTHAIGAILAIIGLYFLLNDELNQQNITRLLAFSIYGFSLVILLLASSFYHAINKPQLKYIFKTIDHCAIYLLIAGTYTPLLMLLFQKTLATQLLLIIWGLAVLGILFKVTLGTQYKVLSLSTYLGMGFISLFIINKLYIALPIEGLILLLSGGFFYSSGVFFYVKNSISYNHAIWHIFVLLGASSHFAMMFYL